MTKIVRARGNVLAEDSINRGAPKSDGCSSFAHLVDPSTQLRSDQKGERFSKTTLTTFCRIAEESREGYFGRKRANEDIEMIFESSFRKIRLSVEGTSRTDPFRKDFARELAATAAAAAAAPSAKFHRF